MNQKAYLEIDTGLIYTVLPYSSDAVYISWMNSPYEREGRSIRNDYFESLIKEHKWIELKEDGAE